MIDICRAYCPAPRLSNGPIKRMKSLSNGVLQMVLETGSIPDVLLFSHFKEARLRPLWDETVWNDVDTNERFIYWYRDEMEVMPLINRQISSSCLRNFRQTAAM